MASPEREEFRYGGEDPDVTDREFGVFVGDPRLRQQISDEAMTTIDEVEAAAQKLHEQDNAAMGINRPSPLPLDEILQRYDDEMN